MEPVFCDNCGDRIWRKAFDLPIPMEDKPNRVICNKCIQELYQISVEVTESNTEEELNSEDGTKEELNSEGETKEELNSEGETKEELNSEGGTKEEEITEEK